MPKLVRLNFVVPEETSNLCREIATAKGISMAELFKRMLHKEEEESKELLQKWRALEELRNK